MKGVIIGTDLLQDENGNVKVLEINTSVGIYQDANEYLDFDGFISVLLENSISELHFIFNSRDINIQNTPNYGDNPLFEELPFRARLKSKCLQNNIQYFDYEVMDNAVTVPYIEDNSSRFILRQAYDSTALIDSEYCADKFKFQDLIEGQDYAPDTYINSSEYGVNTLNDVTIGNNPNAVIKYRYPDYDKKEYPQLFNVPNNDELSNLKENLQTDYLLQKYVYSDNNIVNNKHTVIRSMDVLYGGTLDVFHFGSFTVSSLVHKDVWGDEITDEITGKLSNKTRVKYINGYVTDVNDIVYHVDNDTKILDSDDVIISINDISVGTNLKSVVIDGLNKDVDLSVFTSTIEDTQTNLQFVDTSVVEMKSQTYDGLFVKITLADGTSWSDVPGTNLYIQLSGTTNTAFRRVNMLRVGDKILTLNKVTNEISSVEITNLEVTFENKTIYELDVEESDLFLTSVGDENSVLKLAIQHNPCYGCSWTYCGSWACQSYCPSCAGCFAEGTLIKTPSGFKKIEEFEDNDYVLSMDFDKNEMVNKKSFKLVSFDYDGPLVIINGHNTRSTVGHPFAVRDKNGVTKWAAYNKHIDATFFDEGVEVFDLTDDEYEIYLKGEWVKIEKIDLEHYVGKVYNIAVEETHNYVANDVLVHNIVKKEYV